MKLNIQIKNFIFPKLPDFSTHTHNTHKKEKKIEKIRRKNILILPIDSLKSC